MEVGAGPGFFAQYKRSDIVSDITPSLEQQAYDFELEKTPDGQGFFGYKRQYKTYVDVISYTKMVADAKKRNAILFEKLGMRP